VHMRILTLGLALFFPLSLVAQNTGRTSAANEPERGFTISSLRSDYRVQFLFVARDEITREPVSEFKVEAFSGSALARADGSVWGDGVLRIALAGGQCSFRISAEGYDAEVIDSIDVPGKGVGVMFSGFPLGTSGIDPFVGTTIGLEVLLRRSNAHFARQERRHSFLSDTTFYDITNPAAEPADGIRPLQNRIRDGLKSLLSANDSSFKVMTQCITYINKEGNVVRTRINTHERDDVSRVISEAVQRTKFKAGLILGKPVNSIISIPFSVHWKLPNPTTQKKVR
jgi:hypothetical protein